MADPTDTDITQLDLQALQEKHPEKAAALARARLAALYDQQTHAMLGMGGAMPELQKLGAAEYGQAGREREGVQQTAANVLKQTLGEKESDARLKQLQQQLEYQRGELGLQGQHLAVSLIAPLIPALIKSGADIATIKALSGLLGKHIGKKVGDVISTRPEAEQKAVTDILGQLGISLGDVLKPPAEGKPQKGAKKAAPTQRGPTHYKVSPDGSMRIATDANGVPLPGAAPEEVP